MPKQLKRIAEATERIATVLEKLLYFLNPIVGLEIMHLPVNVTKGLAPHVKGTPISSFDLVDNGNGNFLVNGKDASGNPVALDPTKVILAAVSGNEAVVTVAVTGVNFSLTAVVGQPLTQGIPITLTVTWNDSSVGPFSAVLNVNTVPGPVTGLAIEVA